MDRNSKLNLISSLPLEFTPPLRKKSSHLGEGAQPSSLGNTPPKNLILDDPVETPNKKRNSLPSLSSWEIPLISNFPSTSSSPSLIFPSSPSDFVSPQNRKANPNLNHINNNNNTPSRSSPLRKENLHFSPDELGKEILVDDVYVPKNSPLQKIREQVQKFERDRTNSIIQMEKENVWVAVAHTTTNRKTNNRVILGHRRNSSVNILPANSPPKRSKTYFDQQVEPTKRSSSTFSTKQGKNWTEVISGVKETLMEALIDQSWAKPTISKRETRKTILRSVTDKLISPKITDHLPFVDQFLLSYQFFTDSIQLFDFLVSSFSTINSLLKEIPDKTSFEELKEKKNNILYIFKRWFALSFSDFKNPEMNRKVEGLINFLKTTEIHTANYLHSEYQLAQLTHNLQPEEKKITSLTDFGDAPISLLAKQITLLEFSFFSDISLPELIGKLDSDLNERFIFPQLVNAFHTSSQIVSLWIATEILSCPNLKQRISMLHRVLLLAKNLLNLGNYHSAYSIYRALTMPCISRLKRTWNDLASLTSVAPLDAWQKLSEVFSKQNDDISTLVDKMKEHPPPLVPPLKKLALRYTELYFAYQSERRRDKAIIPFEILAKMSDIAHVIKRAQSTSYGFAFHTVFQDFLFSGLTICSVSKLNYKSYLLEPASEAPQQCFSSHPLIRSSKVQDPATLLFTNSPIQPFVSETRESMRSINSLLSSEEQTEEFQSPYLPFFQFKTKIAKQQDRYEKVLLLSIRAIELALIRFSLPISEKVGAYFLDIFPDSSSQSAFVNRLLLLFVDHCTSFSFTDRPPQIEFNFLMEKLLIEFFQQHTGNFWKKLNLERNLPNLEEGTNEFALGFMKIVIFATFESNFSPWLKNTISAVENRVNAQKLKLGVLPLSIRILLKYFVLPFLENPVSSLGAKLPKQTANKLSSLIPLINNYADLKDTPETNVITQSMKRSVESFQTFFSGSLAQEGPKSYTISTEKREIAYEYLKEFFIENLDHFGALVPKQSNLFEPFLSTQLFNYPLEAIFLRDQVTRVPVIIGEFFEIILENPVENIFRELESPSVISEYVNQLNFGGKIERAALIKNPHVAASLLIEFLKQLPKPLIKLDHLTPIMDSIEDQKIEQIKKLFSNLSSARRYFLYNLLTFLLQVSKLSSKTKISLSEISSIFAPLIVEQSEEIASDLVLFYGINQFFEFLIVNHQQWL